MVSATSAPPSHQYGMGTQSSSPMAAMALCIALDSFTVMDHAAPALVQASTTLRL